MPQTPDGSAKVGRIVTTQPSSSHSELGTRNSELGRIAVLGAGVVRVAVTGRTVGPPLFETMELLGADTVKRRMDEALARLAPLGVPSCESKVPS